MRKEIFGAILLWACGVAVPVWGQATTRTCGAVEEPGPACLLSHKELPSLRAGPLFWHLDRFKSKALAERALTPTSSVVEAFGVVWLFTIERSGWRAGSGTHVAEIGPLPVEPTGDFAAEYLRSIFQPGTSAPLHTHSGPEAFYAVTGDTCLETPAGVQIGRGAGNSLLIKAGSPMLLMAIGKVPRQGFALILHDAKQAPTTLTQAWKPEGRCAQQLLKDQGQ